MRLGNQTNLHEAQVKGAQANKERSEAHIQRVAEILKEIGASGMKIPRIVEKLNAMGSKTSRGNPWTAAALRSVQKAIKASEALAETAGAKDPDAHYRTLPHFGRF